MSDNIKYPPSCMDVICVLILISISCFISVHISGKVSTVDNRLDKLEKTVFKENKSD